MWFDLDDITKTRWETAAGYSNLTGWELFLQDTCDRKVNGLLGCNDPKDLYQYKVGEIISPDSEQGGEFIAISQFLGGECKVWQKIVGKQKMYELVEYYEAVTSPIKVEMSYYSNLVDSGFWNYLRLRVSMLGVKGGVYDWYDEEVDLNKIQDWVRFSHTFGSDMDSIDRYYITILMEGLHGNFCFDNLNFEHDGENWAKNKNCDMVDEDVMPNWGYELYAWALAGNSGPCTFHSAYVDNT